MRRTGSPRPSSTRTAARSRAPRPAFRTGTRSYVVMMEDPDVGHDPPFVHWTIYDLPPDVTELREGVPGQPRLLLPDGALQGRNDRGSTGYFGMRPPKGDPAHHYHVQVFALD